MCVRIFLWVGFPCSFSERFAFSFVVDLTVGFFFWWLVLVLSCVYVCVRLSLSVCVSVCVCTRSVEALSEVLSDWGEGRGSIVVISHDKAFCEQVGFTHILTITGEGGLHLEQRDANESDWDSTVATFQKSMGGEDEDDAAASGAGEATAMDKELLAKRRKMAYNAPKRIEKIESLVEQKEEKMAALDDEMLANGSDVGKLVDLSKEKEGLEEEVMELMEEWEELETVIAEMEELAVS